MSHGQSLELTVHSIVPLEMYAMKLQAVHRDIRASSRAWRAYWHLLRAVHRASIDSVEVSRVCKEEPTDPLHGPDYQRSCVTDKLSLSNILKYSSNSFLRSLSVRNYLPPLQVERRCRHSSLFRLALKLTLVFGPYCSIILCFFEMNGCEP